MAISVFDLFKIGIGPSSSHTVGPMRAARSFVLDVEAAGQLGQTAGVNVELFGSLGATGRGHGSDKAIILGLMGETPEGVDVIGIPGLVSRVRQEGRLPLLGRHEIAFKEAEHLHMLRKTLPYHPNGMRFTALAADGHPLRTRVYYSVGGGFVVDERAAEGQSPIKADATPLPYPFTTAVELLGHCKARGLRISQVMLENE